MRDHAGRRAADEGRGAAGGQSIERQPAWRTGTSFTPARTDKPCAIVGTDQGEELFGSEYDDVFYALGGDDTVRGLGGHDRIFDGKGIDRFEGGEGGDRILSPATRATTFSWRATAAARRSGAARASTEPGPEASDRPFGVERAIR